MCLLKTLFNRVIRSHKTISIIYQETVDRKEPCGYYFGLRSVAQPGSAPGLGPGGPRFESLYSDQNTVVN